jgi:hypothetical protein
VARHQFVDMDDDDSSLLVNGEILCEGHREISSLRAVGGNQDNLEHIDNLQKECEWYAGARCENGPGERWFDAGDSGDPRVSGAPSATYDERTARGSQQLRTSERQCRVMP